MSKEKPYNNNQWTESRFRSFVISALRSASNRWGPKYTTIKEARTERGKYQCVGFDRKPHIVTASVLVKGKRKKNIFADHINPVVDPAMGFVSYDEFIKRLFVEREGFQPLCLTCHASKTAEERKQRK